MVEVVDFLAVDSFSEEGLNLFKRSNKIKLKTKNHSNSDVTILVVGLKTFLDKDLFNEYSSLKILASPTTGIDHIDVDEANRRNLKIISLQGESDFLQNISSTSELSFSLLLSLSRKVIPAYNSVLSGKWNRESFRGNSLKGKNLGIVGLGRLGKIMRNYAESFDMNVFYTDPYLDGGLELNHLLELSDFVSIHVPLNYETTGMFDKEKFTIMKQSSFLVNTSRGKVVNEKDLIQALESNEIAGYGTDVLSDELKFDKEISSPLIDFARKNDNVIITPHIGGMTEESRNLTDIFISEKILKHVMES